MACNYCGEFKKDLEHREYPYEKGRYCEECCRKLDRWTIEDWDDFYDDMKRASELHEEHIEFEQPAESAEEKWRRQTEDENGTCNLCGKSRRYGHCVHV
ncbi:hypothetical protein IMZ31_23460 (plasmid) [Pontibacillus sp. ALD_SL1]|uniref:hypothetical protein n=1 Tax=Pontibacillus sp. ALD_SL1 TaxID=2777185 RepID=UPI001A96131D|nr:hypothetical protein [Pontibacillus sp. ALD_SL1]QST02411.1 hypothetical protein IMZ31_23460 [Pontibacillus sp. ALD_SL1]